MRTNPATFEDYKRARTAGTDIVEVAFCRQLSDSEWDILYRQYLDGSIYSDTLPPAFEVWDKYGLGGNPWKTSWERRRARWYELLPEWAAAGVVTAEEVRAAIVRANEYLENARKEYRKCPTGMRRGFVRDWQEEVAALNVALKSAEYLPNTY